MSERPESDAVEQARDRAIDALVDWSVAPPGSGRHVHDILDDFQQAILEEHQEKVEALVKAARWLLTSLDECVHIEAGSSGPLQWDEQCGAHGLDWPCPVIAVTAALQPFLPVSTEGDGRG